MSLLVIVPSLVCLAAAAAVLYALRGRRVDDHPICHKCGFDLVGKPAASAVCSECGVDLGRKRSIRTGNRLRRRRLFALSLPVFLAAGGWLGVVGWGAAKGVDW